VPVSGTLVNAACRSVAGEWGLARLAAVVLLFGWPAGM